MGNLVARRVKALLFFSFRVHEGWESGHPQKPEYGTHGHSGEQISVLNTLILTFETARHQFLPAEVQYPGGSGTGEL